VTYQTAGGGERAGVVSDDGVIRALPAGVALIDLIARGHVGLRAAGDHALAKPDEVMVLGEVTLQAPIPRPPAIRDCLCFLDHLRNVQQALGMGRELKDAWFRVPAFYFANPANVFGPYEDVPIAPGSAWQDFELEIAAVIGAGGKDLSVAEAEDAIIGYTILNDWSARDLQNLETQMGIGQGKGKGSGITLGPYLVTADELAPHRARGKLALGVTALINDRVIGSGSTTTMDWSFGEVVSFASRGVTLRPGDVIGSGTVPTCTLLEHVNLEKWEAFDGWLHDGDVVTLRVDGLGETRQRLRATAAPHPLRTLPDPQAKPPAPRVNKAPARIPYERGLHKVADSVWAWTLPDGGYGWSNAALISGDGASLLVDTLFDLPLTAEMLSAMRPITDQAPITDAVITHSNGDHTHGNQLLDPSVRILAAEATSEEIAHGMAPEMIAMTQTADLGPIGSPYMRDRFGYFDFSGIKLRNADETFADRLSITVGGRAIEVLNLGPAHTAADSVVHVPDAGVLVAGDLLFVGTTPVVWTGPIANWVAACDTMIALDAPTVIPGHGPITDADGIRALRGYLVHVSEQTDAAYQKGLSFQEAVDDIDLAEYADWLDPERVVTNVYTHYRELGAEVPELGIVALFGLQADWLAKRSAT
jgi:2-keto-4-pentenoate hydratase/2-oxohepta-3-ene-1,7-dioic acid hydratase in catechol pathway/glyoxylase-like metal-dependent hydrolase (beta-lactamase superfamily II)